MERERRPGTIVNFTMSIISEICRKIVELFFLTHDDERAPAAAASEERERSARALRWIDPETRSTDLDVLVCIAADRIPQIKLCSGVQPPDLSRFSIKRSFFLVFDGGD